MPLLAQNRWATMVLSVSRVLARVPPFAIWGTGAHHLVLITAGSMRLEKYEAGRTAPVTMRMNAGDLYISSAGAPRYDLAWNTEAGYEFEALHVHIDNSTTERVCHDNGVPAARSELAPGAVARDPMVALLMSRLHAAMTSHTEGNHAIDALYGDIAAELLAVHLVRAQSRSASSPKRRMLSDRQVRRIRDYVAAHLSEPVRLRDLAGLANISPSHFARAFKSTTGETPHGYLLRCRIDEAKSLLQGGTLNLTEIALRVGFSSQSHLSTRFRSATGLTPTAYRRR